MATACCLHDGKFVTAGEPEGLSGDISWISVTRRAGGVWVGSDGGLSTPANSRTSTGRRAA